MGSGRPRLYSLRHASKAVANGCTQTDPPERNSKRKKENTTQTLKAFSANGEGFYVHAPKQKGNVKKQLGYIGRYIRRPAIAIHRIKQYDGQFVVFSLRENSVYQMGFFVLSEGDPTVLPQFACEQYGGEMYPEYYKGIHGIEYRISDVRK